MRALGALHDSDNAVRAYAALSLRQRDQASPEVIHELCEVVQESRISKIRHDAAHLLGRIGQSDNVVIDALWGGLLDEDDEIRHTSTQVLTQIGRRNTATAELIEKRFVEAIHDPKFEQRDRKYSRPAYDHAYEGFWPQVVGSEIEE